MNSKSINTLGRIIEEILEFPSRSITIISRELADDDIDNIVIAGLSLIKKKLLAHIEASRSHVMFSTVVYAGVALSQVQHLAPDPGTFYCTAAEAQIVGRLILWKATKLIRSNLADCNVSTEDKRAYANIRDAYGLKK